MSAFAVTSMPFAALAKNSKSKTELSVVVVARKAEMAKVLG